MERSIFASDHRQAFDLEALKLGKLAHRHDYRTLHLEHYVDEKALPPPPASRYWSTGVSEWGVMLNDRIGNCTVAAAGHGVQVATKQASGIEVTVPDAIIEQAYSTIGGYVPGDPSTDNGAVILDLLKYWMKTGLGRHRLGGFAQVKPTNIKLIKTAIDVFGFIDIGVLLPVTAQSQIGGAINARYPATPIWKIVPSSSASQPGSWGGHSVIACDYDPWGLICVTWGQRQRMTYNFFYEYCDEAWACFSNDWLNAQGASPSGFNKATLLADLQSVRQLAA